MILRSKWFLVQIKGEIEGRKNVFENIQRIEKKGKEIIEKKMLLKIFKRGEYKNIKLKKADFYSKISC